MIRGLREYLGTHIVMYCFFFSLFLSLSLYWWMSPVFTCTSLSHPLLIVLFYFVSASLSLSPDEPFPVFTCPVHTHPVVTILLVTLQEDEWITHGVSAQEHSQWLHTERQVWAVLITVPPGGIMGQECAAVRRGEQQHAAPVPALWPSAGLLLPGECHCQMGTRKLGENLICSCQVKKGWEAWA